MPLKTPFARYDGMAAGYTFGGQRMKLLMGNMTEETVCDIGTGEKYQNLRLIAGGSQIN